MNNRNTEEYVKYAQAYMIPQYEGWLKDGGLVRLRSSVESLYRRRSLGCAGRTSIPGHQRLRAGANEFSKGCARYAQRQTRSGRTITSAKSEIPIRDGKTVFADLVAH